MIIEFEDAAMICPQIGFQKSGHSTLDNFVRLTANSFFLPKLKKAIFIFTFYVAIIL